LTADEIRALRYANYLSWMTLSRGTRIVAIGASNVDTPWAPRDLAPSIKAVTAAIGAVRATPS